MFFLGIGLYCSIESEKLSQCSALFLSLGATVGLAAKAFCNLLLKLVRDFPAVVAHHVRAKRFNAHGI